MLEREKLTCELESAKRESDRLAGLVRQWLGMLLAGVLFAVAATWAYKRAGVPVGIAILFWAIVAVILAANMYFQSEAAKSDEQVQQYRLRVDELQEVSD